MSHGQQPNAVDRVIVDPGDKGMEGKNPPRGLLYMAVSRATTIGDASNNSSEQRGRRQDSAIYFTGHNMTRNRVLNLTLKKRWVRVPKSAVETKVGIPSGRKHSGDAAG